MTSRLYAERTEFSDGTPISAYEMDELAVSAASSAGAPIRSRFRVYDRTQLDDIPPPVWLIEDTVLEGLAVVFGPSGSGKTFLGLDFACTVATGGKWFGKRATHRRVLFVSAEGASGIPLRVRAWEIDRKRRADDLFVMPEACNLMVPADVEHLSMAIEEVGAGMVVVDTLARSMVGGDENSVKDMGIVIDALDGLRKRHGCDALVIHHSGLDGGRMRGSTAFKGAVDSSIAVERTGDNVFVRSDKQKDGPDFDPWFLRAKTVAGSMVLGLAKTNPTHALEEIAEAMELGPMRYQDILVLVGGDTETVLRLVEDGKLARYDDTGLYVLGDGKPADGWSL